MLENNNPMSNLPFQSRILQKVAATHLKGHLNIHKVHDGLQSAYRKNHSEETALLKVHKDIAEALHMKSMAVLVLLGQQAAFGVRNHRIVQMCLKYSYGNALSWMKSHLCHTLQHVTIGKTST